MFSVEAPPPDARTFAWRDYGNRVGVWRLYELLDDLKLPACHLINTSVFDYAPDVIEPIMARGDEIIGLGLPMQNAMVNGGKRTNYECLQRFGVSLKTEQGLLRADGWHTMDVSEPDNSRSAA